MKRGIVANLICLFIVMGTYNSVDACTGITLNTSAGAPILARTIEWGGSELNSEYVVVPRNYSQQSYLPGMSKEGMKFVSKYGYVGLTVETNEFVVEGLNEKGLSAGLFYFPKYGKYEDVLEVNKSVTLSDLQFVSWILGRFGSVKELLDEIGNIHICSVDPRASTVHWRVADNTGRQIVIEVIDGKIKVYENRLGVLTNSPGFDWQMTNLNNYINLSSGTIGDKEFGGICMKSFGAGSAMLGLPGDVTPPSRFVRAAFFCISAPRLRSERETVMQAFHILNNFDIPIGVEFSPTTPIAPIPSATQWTTATDLRGLKIYYRTMYNGTVRMIDLSKINFDKVEFASSPLDLVKEEPIVEIGIK